MEREENHCEEEVFCMGDENDEEIDFVNSGEGFSLTNCKDFRGV